MVSNLLFGDNNEGHWGPLRNVIHHAKLITGPQLFSDIRKLTEGLNVPWVIITVWSL